MPLGIPLAYQWYTRKYATGILTFEPSEIVYAIDVWQDLINDYVQLISNHNMLSVIVTHVYVICNSLRGALRKQGLFLDLIRFWWNLHIICRICSGIQWNQQIFKFLILFQVPFFWEKNVILWYNFKKRCGPEFLW